MMMQTIKRKISSCKMFFTDGASELMGLLIVLPMLIFMLTLMLGLSQVLMLGPKLEYATYSAARAAAVSDNMETAQKRAETVALENLDERIARAVDPKNAVVKVKLEDGENWERGSYLTCSISAPVNSVTPMFSKTYYESVTMMIEWPAKDDFDFGPADNSGFGVPNSDGSLPEGRKIQVEATAYTSDPAENGGWTVTAMGTPIKRGVIAVDPRVIPLGTKVYVEGYGYARAEDTGGAIKGNRIDVVMDSKSESRLWGRRKVTVVILD